MHELVGIIRTQSELEQALAKIEELKERAEHTSVEGNRQYNPGWHLAMDLRRCWRLGSDRFAAIERKESRGGHTRDDLPGDGPRVGRVERCGPSRAWW